MTMHLLLLALLGAAKVEAAAPFEVSVPTKGASPATTVETPAGTFAFSFEANPPVGVLVTIGGLRLAGNDAMKGAAFELSPVFEPGKFRTRRYTGERWKCLPSGEGKLVTESHDDLLTSRSELTAALNRDDPARFS